MPSGGTFPSHVSCKIVVVVLYLVLTRHGYCKANVTCNVIGSNIPCNQVVTTTDACGPTPVKYSFKYSNMNPYGIFLNYTKFWAIMDGSNQRDKMDTSPMKAGEIRFYAFNHTLNTCSVGTYGQIKVEGLLNVSSYNYCYAYDFVPNRVKSVPSPTRTPTSSPTLRPTAFPTSRPTASPTRKPTASPTSKPSASPTIRPTVSPTSYPTKAPTLKPSSKPTLAPIPTLKPNKSPSSSTTLKPSRAQVPTSNDISLSPTKVPVRKPMKKPSRSAKAP